jgi:predicted TIM-barrel fold metal-dependent hydrolase
MRRTLAFAADRQMPVQVHTGFGDSEIRLSEAHPLLLEELLLTPEGTGPPIVLIHGSFPYHEEAAYLAATRTNVHVDFSLFNLFVPGRLADRLLRLVELTPTAKLLAGTDGFALPEMHWFGAVLAREAWSEVRRRLEEDLRVPSGWIEGAESAIFAGNAQRLYRLAS